MIRGIRVETTLTYSQTLNGLDTMVSSVNQRNRILVFSGPLLVSRNGDVG